MVARCHEQVINLKAAWNWAGDLFERFRQIERVDAIEGKLARQHLAYRREEAALIRDASVGHHVHAAVLRLLDDVADLPG